MRKLFIAAILASTLLSTSCMMYVMAEPTYAYAEPPEGAVFVEPGLWYVDVYVGTTIHRHYYRYNVPSGGYRYYYYRLYHR